MKYICESCNYETNDKSNFNKHMNSKAHDKKTSTIHKVDINVDKKCQQKKLPSSFKCSECNKNYSSTSSLSRHRNKYCKVGALTEQITLQLEQKFDEKVKKRELEMELEYSKKLVDELKQCIKNTKPTNYNISVKKLVQQTFPDAPHIAMLDNYRVIHEDIDFTQDLIYYHNKNRLSAYLGDIIIKYYKKEDPKNQSLWSTDSSRLKYIIKELIATKTSNWSEDDKGLKTTKYIISPLLKYIREYISDKIDELHEELYDANGFECIDINQKQNALSTIREQILNGTLKDEIIKYITPSFKIKSDKLIAI